MNPFDLKTALLAKHAQHVVLIHFPIALFIAGAAFDFAGQWTKRQAMAAAAYYNFALAAIMAVPVLGTGILAWQFALEGQHLKGILLKHLVLGWTSSVLIWVIWWIHFRVKRKEGATLPAYRFVLEALGVAVISLTGHLGGFLSGVNS